jgi:L-alanine-DL-glutamate epimerase-like enolase superfamily enzyme
VRTWDSLAGLPLTIAEAATETLAVDVGRFVRKTTVLHLHGDGAEGVGEDVTYDGAEHERFPRLDLAGTWTLASLSAHLDGVDLFPAAAPSQDAYRHYRRWAVESAALDLALRQAGTTLAAALGRDVRPLTFVVSTRSAGLERWRELYPSIRFKLDPTPEWTEEDFARLGRWGNVDVLDLKGAYRGTEVDNPPDPELYARTAAAVPTAWIEDPALTPETDEVLRPHRDRITWDAPIHSWADVEALPFPPRCLNCKPSRLGSLAALFELYDRCAEHGIALYGGGQFELGPGRGQIQLLAALFHPDGPNDVAPSAYNEGGPRPGLPTSPLELDPGAGFSA